MLCYIHVSRWFSQEACLTLKCVGPQLWVRCVSWKEAAPPVSLNLGCYCGRTASVFTPPWEACSQSWRWNWQQCVVTVSRVMWSTKTGSDTFWVFLFFFVWSCADKVFEPLLPRSLIYTLKPLLCNIQHLCFAVYPNRIIPCFIFYFTFPFRDRCI